MRFFCLLLAIVFPLTLFAKDVLIVCDSATNHTWQLAESVAVGARSVPDTSVTLLRPQEATLEQLMSADAIIVGSPTHKGSPTPAILENLAVWPIHGEFQNKIGAAFTSAGGIAAGLEDTLLAILRAMLTSQMIVEGGVDWRSAYGAYSVTNEFPFITGSDEKYEADFLQIGYRLGKRVAELTHKIY